jgi:hypothetical protein
MLIVILLSSLAAVPAEGAERPELHGLVDVHRDQPELVSDAIHQVVAIAGDAPAGPPK